MGGRVGVVVQRQGARREFRDQLPDVDPAPARGDRRSARPPNASHPSGANTKRKCDEQLLRRWATKAGAGPSTSRPRRRSRRKSLWRSRMELCVSSYCGPSLTALSVASMLLHRTTTPSTRTTTSPNPSGRMVSRRLSPRAVRSVSQLSFSTGPLAISFNRTVSGAESRFQKVT